MVAHHIIIILNTKVNLITLILNISTYISILLYKVFKEIARDYFEYRFLMNSKYRTFYLFAV